MSKWVTTEHIESITKGELTCCIRYKSEGLEPGEPGRCDWEVRHMDRLLLSERVFIAKGDAPDADEAICTARYDCEKAVRELAASLRALRSAMLDACEGMGEECST